MAQGDHSAARAELDRARQLLGQVSTIVLLEGCCAVAEGRRDEGQTAFDELRGRYDSGSAGADDLALLAAVLDDSQSAMHWLTKACRQRLRFLGYVDVEPAMAPLRREPGCRLILRSRGFDADP